MTTHVTTHNPVRSDVPTLARHAGRTSRSWAFAGIGAGVAGIGVIVTSGMVNAVYDEDLVGDTPGVAAKLAISGRKAVQEIDTAQLTGILKQQGAVMEYAPNAQTPILQIIRRPGVR